MRATFRTLALAAVLGILGGGAQAEEKFNWSGLYVGLHGGMGFANTELNLGGGSIDGLGADGLIGGVQAGFDWQLPGSPIIVGAFGEYTWSDVEFSINPGIFSVGIDERWSVGGKAGVALDKVMPYVIGGYTEAKTSGSAGGTSFSGPDLKGWFGGGGIEFTVAKNVSLAAEYRYIQWDTVNLGPGVSLDPDEHQVTARLNLRGSFWDALAPNK